MSTHHDPKPEDTRAQLTKVQTELAEVQQELAALRRVVAELQGSEATRHDVAGSGTPANLTVRSLDVVDSDGKIVASIDGSGHLFCLTLWASTDKNKRGVFIDGKTFRKVSAGTLELIGDAGNHPVVVAEGWGQTGKISLGMVGKPGPGLDLQGGGAALTAYDHATGNAGVQVFATSTGSSVTVTSTNGASKAIAELSVSEARGTGEVTVLDSQGNLVGKLP